MTVKRSALIRGFQLEYKQNYVPKFNFRLDRFRGSMCVILCKLPAFSVVGSSSQKVSRNRCNQVMVMISQLSLVREIALSHRTC